MFPTLILIFFMFFVPNALKKAGVRLLIEEKLSGFFLLIFAKLIWWACFLQLLQIWKPQFLLYGVILSIFGIMVKTLMERNYLFKNIQNKNRA